MENIVYIFNFMEHSLGDYSGTACFVLDVVYGYVYVCICQSVAINCPKMPIGIISDAPFWRHDTRQAKKTPPVLCLPHHVQQPQLQQQQHRQPAAILAWPLAWRLECTLRKLALPLSPASASASAPCPPPALVPHLYLSKHTLGRNLFVSRVPLLLLLLLLSLFLSLLLLLLCNSAAASISSYFLAA